MPRRRNVVFSVSRSCATSSDRAPGRTGTSAGEELRRLGGYAFPLVRDDGRATRDLGERGVVAQRTDDQVAHGAGGRTGGRVEEAEAQTERDAGQPQHATELPTAEHCEHLVGHPVLSSAPIGEATG